MQVTFVGCFSMKMKEARVRVPNNQKTAHRLIIVEWLLYYLVSTRYCCPWIEVVE